MEGAVNETIKWLDASQEASKEEYEEKQKELEGIAKYVLLSSTNISLGSPSAYLLAPSCKNSTVLRVVLHLLPLAVHLAASLVPARMVRAWRKSINFYLFEHFHLTIKIMNVICNISTNHHTFFISLYSFINKRRCTEPGI